MLQTFNTYIWANNKKDSHVTFGGNFGSHIEDMKNTYKLLFHAKNSYYIHLQVPNIRIYSEILFHQK